MTTQPINHLFVYGTLMRGGRSPYAQLLQARARFIGEASIAGRLYHLGRFPGAVPDQECRTRVAGEIFLIKDDALMDALDRYEGCRPEDAEPRLFRRDAVEVRTARGSALNAWVYTYTGGTAGRPIVPSGRFLTV
jgi:gamma-glutamylcyclotransferase (GGCT)/AIG2-like uncharacterized protein YtfP